MNEQRREDDSVVLVDVMNLAWRMHHVFPHLSSDGFPTSVLHGFLKTIGDVAATTTRRMVFCWDHGIPVDENAFSDAVALPSEMLEEVEPWAATDEKDLLEMIGGRPRNWRDDIVANYKGGRKRDEEAWSLVLPQLAPLARTISHLGWRNSAVVGLEADDLFGIFSKSLRGRVLMMTTDHDAYQLLRDGVLVLKSNRRNGSLEVRDARKVEAEYAVPISRWAEYLALGGDKSDSIKPARGMGPATAAKLIASGVDLSLPKKKQPAEFLKKWGEHWDAILRCHQAALLPTTVDDPRVSKLINAEKREILSTTDGRQFWKDKKKSRAEFERICADLDLVHLLSLRRVFFENVSTKSSHEETFFESRRNKTCRTPRTQKRIPRLPIKRLI